MQVQDRIKELRRVPASELRANPKNWRLHPEQQKQAMSGILEQIGYADALLARELEDGTLLLIDGHLRAETTPDQEVPVLIVDVTEAEADLILATLDPLAAMAETDFTLFDGLMSNIEADSEKVQEMLDDVLLEDRLQVFAPKPVRLEELRAHPNNYKNHPPDQIEHMISSIQQHGQYQNIIIARDGTVLAGNGILKAAQKMKLKALFAVRLDLDPNDSVALKLVVADNEISHLGKVDDRALSEILLEVKEADTLLGTGYDEMMLANLILVTRPAEEISDINAAAEYVGMPEYEEGGDPLKMIFTFRNPGDRKKFCEEFEFEGFNHDINTLRTWWPSKERSERGNVAYE